jgi:hypothetical protein
MSAEDHEAPMFTGLAEVGVLIFGDPAAPTITNHTDRCIIYRPGGHLLDIS